MSGGEEGAYRVLPSGGDWWWRCQGLGCEYEVMLPEQHCHRHGGGPGPVRSTSVYGDVVYLYTSGDAETDTPETAA